MKRFTKLVKPGLTFCTDASFKNRLKYVCYYLTTFVSRYYMPKTNHELVKHVLGKYVT